MPSIKMALPSFSGHTEHQPQLLKYSCDMECRIRIVPPAKVLAADSRYCHHVNHNISDDTSNSKQNMDLRSKTKIDAESLVIAVLITKPILSLVFEHMKLHVKVPTLVAPK